MVKKKINDIFKKYSLTFISLNIYLIIIILLPKSCSELFGIIPVRTFLTYLLFFIFIYDKKRNNIQTNKFNFKLIAIFYLLFLACTIPSFTVTYNLLVSIYTFIKFSSFLLLLYVCLKLKLEKEDYKILIQNVIICSCVKFIWGIAEYVFDINLFKVGSYKYPGSKGRVSSNFFNTIYYGIYINIIFGYLFYFFGKSKTKKSRLFNGIILLLAYVNLLLTFTRSAFLVFCGIIFLILVLLNKKIITKYTIIMLCLLVAVSFAIPGVNSFAIISVNDAISLLNIDVSSQFLPGTSEEIEENDLEDPSLNNRKEFAKMANLIAADHPYIGVGFGAYIDYLNSEEFEVNYPDYNLSKTHPHSSYVLMYAEVSFIAIIFFTLFLLKIFIEIFKSIIKNYKNDEVKFSISVIALAIFVGFMIVNLIAENVFYDTQIFPIFIIVIGLSLSYCYNIDNKGGLVK